MDYRNELLSIITNSGELSPLITGEVTLPGNQELTAAWPSWVNPLLLTKLQSEVAPLPWLHQVTAAEAIWAEKPTIISTGTGSGKSLAVWLAILSKLADVESTKNSGQKRYISRLQGGTTALYLAPTKALARDQLSKLLHLTSGVIPWNRVSAVDGDSASEIRFAAQRQAQIVLSNPDFLHYSMLARHQHWRRFLKDLKYLVVDEIHYYRGTAGGHLALVIARLRRLVRHYGGGDLTVVFASATVAEPAQLAATYLGKAASEVVSVSVNHAPEVERSVMLCRPELSETVQAAQIMARLITAGKKTLAFVRSRQAAESLSLITKELLGDDSKMAGYRGGYLAEERRELEAAIQSGEVLGLATTNALELGVDISGLDAVLIVGWPGTKSSFWQQVGRVGRAGRFGAAVFIARPDPLDSYFVHNPDVAFSRNLETQIVDPSNSVVLAGQLSAAASEYPISAEDFQLFEEVAGEEFWHVLEALTGQGTLQRRGDYWLWPHETPATNFVSLRGGDAVEISIVEDSSGRLIGTASVSNADSQLHSGAIYLHQGESYLVEDYQVEQATARVSKFQASYSTWATSSSAIEILDELEVAKGFSGATAHYGSVRVANQVTGFMQRSKKDQKVVGIHDLELPVRNLESKAFWLTIPRDVLLDAGISSGDLAGALHAAEHCAIGVLPVFANCDRWDLGGVSTAFQKQTGEATIFVYDAAPGGSGLSFQGFKQLEEWFKTVLNTISNCSCPSGCPACIQSPKCGNGNEPLAKTAAVALLTRLVSAGEGKTSLD